ncbi:MAG: hypothetical protein JW760_03885 [Spirochaetales bacterium]|nr:hypothetical protein [Spirochaetales bacterium]
MTRYNASRYIFPIALLLPGRRYTLLGMFVQTSLVVLSILDAALIYMIYSYNRKGTINRFLALLLIPVTLANIEMLVLYTAESRILFSFGLNFAVFDMNFFFPLIYHFSFYFPRKRIKKGCLSPPIFAYTFLLLMGSGLALTVNPDTSLVNFRTLFSLSQWISHNPIYYILYLLNFLFLCVLLTLTIIRMVRSLKLPLLEREKKTVIMVLIGFIPLSVLLVFNYLIFTLFLGGVYFYLAVSLGYTFYFIILVFRFGFLDMKSINRVFLLLPGFFIILIVLYTRVLPPVHALIQDILGLSEPVIVSLEILLFIVAVPPLLRLVYRLVARNRPGESEFFFHTLKSAAGELVGIIDLSRLDRFFTELFVYRLRLRTFYFLFFDEVSKTYRPVKAHHGEDFPFFPVHGELAERLRFERKPANTQQLALSWIGGEELEILDHQKIVLLFPLLEGNSLSGMLMFGEPGVARSWREEEIDELEMFASGIPVVLARCRTHAQAIAMEQKQARIERMAVLHEITSGIAHELRNPLSIISNSAETIASRDLPREDVQRLAGYIEEETKRMSGLLNRILSFIPKGEYHHGITNVIPVLEKTFDLVSAKATRQGTKLSITCPKNHCSAVIDREALTQVCLNLAINALEAVESDGFLSVCVDKRDDRLIISFANNGGPIPEEVRSKVFNPFFTTKVNGTGLGLSISSRLVEEAGGSIQCKNIGDEVVFEIHLPIPTKKGFIQVQE